MSTKIPSIPIVTAAFIIIGNEILSGRTKDANLNFLAETLVEAGIRLQEVRIIPDSEEVIVKTILELKNKFDHVFTSGGIGPTHDDITCDSVAKSFGLPVYHHPEAVKRMQMHALDRNVELNESRMRMARTPKGADLILNSVSAAPGFTVKNVHVMAGVPIVFRAMVQELVPQLEGGAKIHTIAIDANIGEGVIAAKLSSIQDDFPHLDIGSYPYFRKGIYGTTLVVTGTSKRELRSAYDNICQLIQEMGGIPRSEEDTK